MTINTISQLFERPIDRSINGVIKADQLDRASQWQELDEYVVTEEIRKYLSKFLAAYLDPNASGNGVWVSGFFGSGKSHFIKILSYLIKNIEVGDGDQTRRAIDFFDGKFKDPMVQANIRRLASIPAEVILFNVDSRAKSNVSSPILDVFLRVFNESVGYCEEHPHIAHLEREIDRRGKLAEFHQAFAEASKSTWEAERGSYLFFENELHEALSTVLGAPVTEAAAWVDRFTTEFDPTPQNFAGWVRDYLDFKGGNHRIVFVADEMGAFIGKNGKMMLNLQTITENLGTKCSGRAMVVVTSQANIDVIVGDMPASDRHDFSKIQARFPVRPSLSGTHAGEVIRVRLLSKRDEAVDPLADLYASVGENMRHHLQFREAGFTYDTYADAADFVASYPFVPYQFQLVQKIFDASRKHGAVGSHLAQGERSMLDAFQTAARAVSGMSLGHLAPLHYCYDTIEGFLEDRVRKAINGVKNNSSLMEFDLNVIKTLFLIRYVDEMPGNVDNLIVMLTTSVDIVRSELRTRIEKSLARLERETLVSRDNDVWFFLTNEEQDVAREIKLIDLAPGSDINHLKNVIFEDVLTSLKSGKFEDRDYGVTYDVDRMVDERSYKSAPDGAVKFDVVSPASFDGSFAAKYHRNGVSDEDGVIIMMPEDDKGLFAEITAYLQVSQFAKLKMDGKESETVRRIVRERQSENEHRSKRIASKVKELLEASYYLAYSERQLLKSKNAGEMAIEALVAYAKSAFKSRSLVDRPSADPMKDISRVLEHQDESLFGKDGDEGPQMNAEALHCIVAFVEDQAHRSTVCDVSGIVKRFADKPYGWDNNQSAYLVAVLSASGRVDVWSGHEVLDGVKLASSLKSPREWDRLTVKPRKVADPNLLTKVRDLHKEIFGTAIVGDEDAVRAAIRSGSTMRVQKLTDWKRDIEAQGYPGAGLVRSGLEIFQPFVGQISNSALLTDFNSAGENLLAFKLKYKSLENFFANQRSIWDDMTALKAEARENEFELRKSESANGALTRIGNIFALEHPYQEIANAKRDVESVRLVLDKLAEDRREGVLAVIDKEIAALKGDIATSGAPGDISNACLTPLQNLRKVVESSSNIPFIHKSQSDADGLTLDAEDRLKDWIKQQGGTGQGAQDSESGLRPKTRINLSDIVSEGGVIETREELEQLVGAIRRSVEPALSRGERVVLKWSKS